MLSACGVAIALDMHHFFFSDRWRSKRFSDWCRTLLLQPLGAAIGRLTAITLVVLVPSLSAMALDWVPTDEELAKYRKGWNQPTHGPSYASNADVNRQGQWFVRAYVQGMIGSGE